MVRLRGKGLVHKVMPYKYMINIVFLITILLFMVIMVSIYVTMVSPLRLLHTINDSKFLKQFMRKQLLASKDNKLLNTMASHLGNVTCKVDYWYLYFHIRTEQHTLYLLVNLVNKFSDKVNICFYGLDHIRNDVFSSIVPIEFRDINITSKTPNLININHSEHLNIDIDFENDILLCKLNIPDHLLNISLKIEDWNTNQPTFCQRYQNVAGIINVYGAETKTPGEWMVDSPCIGKVIGGVYNNTPLLKGQFWFDTYLGTNNHFLSQYMWFYIQNDDWLIYLLEYGEYADRGNSKNVQPILIKDIKNNKFIYSGLNMDIMQPFNTIRKMTSTFSSTYNLHDGELGDSGLSMFDVDFKSNEINIKITSIPEHGRKIFSYDYYRNDDINIDGLSSWDKKYYNCIKNIRFIEHLGMADVTIFYMGKTIKFKDRIMYEGKRRIKQDIPPTILYKNK